MFNSKQTTLFGSKQKTSATSTMVVPENPFLKAGFRQSVTTNKLGNGATKLTTTGSDFVDQFASTTNYRKPRTYAEISDDMQKLWSQNPFLTMCLLFYLRMIYSNQIKNQT